MLQQVLKELRTECSRKGKDVHWKLFEQWLLEPDVEADNIRLADIAAGHGVVEPSKAYNMISNVKERFRTILRNHLAQLVSSDEEIDAEIADFVNIFSLRPPRYG